MMRQQILAVMGGGQGLRWQSDEQLHLTLRFIGEVDRHQAEDIAAALGTVRHPPVTFALAGIGTFASRGRPDSLWAGVTPHDGLRALHQRIDRALRGVGVPPEGRAYLPHITLARLGRLAIGVPDIQQAWAALASPPATLDHFTLYESHLGTGGASYEAIARYPLG